MNNTVLYKKIEDLPEHIRSQVSDFIDFLLSKTSKNKSAPSGNQPKFGSGKGMFRIKKGFDDTLEDFKEYM